MLKGCTFSLDFFFRIEWSSYSSLGRGFRDFYLLFIHQWLIKSSSNYYHSNVCIHQVTRVFFGALCHFDNIKTDPDGKEVDTHTGWWSDIVQRKIRFFIDLSCELNWNSREWIFVFCALSISRHSHDTWQFLDINLNLCNVQCERKKKKTHSCHHIFYSIVLLLSTHSGWSYIN